MHLERGVFPQDLVRGKNTPKAEDEVEKELMRIYRIAPVAFSGADMTGFTIGVKQEEILCIIQKTDYEKLPEESRPTLIMRYIFKTPEEQEAFSLGSRIEVVTGFEPFATMVYGSPQSFGAYDEKTGQYVSEVGN